MKTQNYSNHVRYYAPHHFIFYPAAIVLLVASIYFGFKQDENSTLWFILSGTILLLGSLSFMLRQHYALTNQNRILKLELRFRYYVLTQRRFEDLEKHLNESQILALRFAPDDELPLLAERAMRENLPPDLIKRSIKNWLPDDIRV